MEDWDDDDLVIEGDLTFRSSANSTNAPSARRDSHSSHFSFRSDLESMGGEEERHVHLPGDDEKARLDAIATAEKAGIPIPHNVPPSALMGGTIKRLGGRKIQKIIQDDWGDDLEIPDTGQGLHIKTQDSSKFPEVLRQVSSSVHPSPTKYFKSSSPALPQDAMPPPPPKPKTLAAPIDLDKYRDDEDDDDLFGDGSATIRVPKNRQPKPLSLITPPTPQKKGNLVSQPEPERVDGDDDFENDFELPSDGKLKLSTKRDIPKTPSLAASDDFDWGEGSLGTRFGGTRRDGRSNRSSSVSALSPSVSSSITAESEDETFDGLVLPHGLNFSERLKQRRRRSRSPARIVEEPSPQPVLEKVPEAVAETPAAPPAPTSIPEKPMPTETDKDDFFADLDLGDVDVLTSGKLNLHKNVKIKEMRPPSPQRPKTAVSITFTSKPQPQHPASRLPRPMTSHERTLTQSSLEPVSESGGPILSRTRRSQSRLGHSAQSSVSSVQTPTTPSSATSLPPSTPRRRELGQKTSAVSLRNEPTTTSAQLLRLKRSLPAMRQQPSPVRPTTSTYARPPSRTDGRPQSGLRPKTPVDRPRTVESAAAQARRNPVPFLPAGASAAQSHNVNAKVGRPLRRHDSDNVLELRPGSRAISRSTMRSPSPKRYHDVGRLVVDGSWHQLSKPMRPRHFGDGHELDGFDDLPTSAQAESRFIRQPVNASGKNSLRNKIYQNLLPDRMSTPSPSVPQSPYTPYSPARTEYTPHYLRDTAASRIARETSLAQRAPSTGPLAPLTAQRVAQLSTRTNLNPALPQSQLRSKKPLKRPPQLKPHLIANLNPPKESKGMLLIILVYLIPR